MYTPQTTLTVTCPDGITRQAQVTSVVGDVVRLSVRQNGVRYTGTLQGGTYFKATNGENGNVWEWLNVKHPELLPEA